MASIALEAFHEKKRLHLRSGDLNDLGPILGLGDMKDLLVGVEIVSISLQYSPISKMNDDLILNLNHDNILFSPEGQHGLRGMVLMCFCARHVPRDLRKSHSSGSGLTRTGVAGPIYSEESLWICQRAVYKDDVLMAY
jgi:hypothetical protein